jgi:putative endonuclease
MGAFVYLLRCVDDAFYVGSATGEDISKRIAEHNAGAYGGYTATRRPVQLVWSQYFERITDAIAMERRLKGWSRAKKEALIANDWKDIERLSKRRAGRPPTKSGPSPLRCLAAGQASKGRGRSSFEARFARASG